MATRIEALYYELFAKTDQLTQATTQVDRFGTSTKTTGAGVGALSAAMTQLGAVSAATTSAMATGAQKASASIKTAGDNVSAVQKKFGNASFAIASTLEGVARAGTTSSEAMKTLIRQGSNAAFFFGPTGAFVGALGTAVLALVALFRRPREELEELQKAGQQLARSLREDAGGSARRAAVLFAGDPEAEGITPGSQRAERLGIARLRALRDAAAREVQRLTQLRQELQGAGAADPTPGRFTQEDAQRVVAWQRLNAQIVQANLLLSEHEAELEKIEPIYDKLRAQGAGGEGFFVGVLRRELESRIKEEEDAASDAAKRAEQFAELQRDLAEATRLVDRQMQGLHENIDKAFSDSALEKARALEEIMAEITVSEVDNLQIGLRKLLEELEDNDAPREFIEQVTAIQTAAINSRRELEQLQKFIASLKSSPTPLIDLGIKRLEIESQLADLKGDDEATTQRRIALETQLKELDEARAAAIRQYKGDNDDAAGTTQLLATTLADAASAAFGIATGLLGADHAATRLLGSVTQIFSGISRIGQLAADAGGLSKLLSTGSGVVSALGPLGAILGGGIAIAAAFGDSPAEQERRRLIEENNRRLAELRDGLITAAISISGRSAAAIASVPTGIPLTISPAIAGLKVESRIGAVLEDLRKAGVSMEELRRVAADLGITLKGNIPTFEEFLQIQEGIRIAGVKELFGTLAGQLKFLDLQARAIGFSDEDVLLRKARVLSDAVPLFADAFRGVDIRTTEGRAEAIRRLIETLENLKNLSPEQLALLGDLPIGEFADQLVEFIEALRRLDPAVAAVVDGITESVDEAQRAAEAAAARSAAVTRVRQRLAITDMEDNAQAVLEALLQVWQEQIPSLRGLMQRFAGGSLDDTIRNIFKAIDEGVIALVELGVPLDEFLAALLEIESASDAAARALHSVVSVLEQIENIDLETELLGGDRTAPDVLRRKLETLFPSTGGLPDLTNLQGISDAIALVRWAIQNTADPERKAALQAFLRDLIGAYQALQEGANATPGGGGAGARGGGDLARTGVTQLTERTGFTLVDLTRTEIVILREIAELLRTGAVALRPVGFTPLSPPSSAVIAPLVAAAQQGGGITLYVTQNIHVHVGSGLDGEAVGQSTARHSRAAIEELDQRLFQNVQGRRRVLGSADVT